MKQSKIKQKTKKNLLLSIKQKKKVYFLGVLECMEIKNAKKNKGGKSFHIERRVAKKMGKVKHKLKQFQSISKVFIF